MEWTRATVEVALFAGLFFFFGMTGSLTQNRRKLVIFFFMVLVVYLGLFLFGSSFIFIQICFLVVLGQDGHVLSSLNEEPQKKCGAPLIGIARVNARML